MNNQRGYEKKNSTGQRGIVPSMLLVCAVVMAVLLFITSLSAAGAKAASPAANVVTSITPPTTAGAADALLLSCMDYRLVNETHAYMEHHGLKDKYDHVILAGASLGATNTKFPAWGTTFWEHLATAIQLHNIHEVIIMDHRDCGAYKVILGQDFAKDPVAEKAIHAKTMQDLAKQIKTKYPKLEVELLLIDLSGHVEEIELAKAADKSNK